MSYYKDIYSDLPSRIFKVWQRTRSQNTGGHQDFSVTAMLMAAAAGFAMPFENLKNQGVTNGEKWKDHPMFHKADKIVYQAALKKCDAYFRQTISACEGLNGAVLMQCQELKSIRSAASTGQGDASMDTAKYNVKFALRILRNALAHNNILSLPYSDGEIEKIAFFSMSNWCPGNGHGDGWNILILPVQSFEIFLEKWFELLSPSGGLQGAALALAEEK